MPEIEDQPGTLKYEREFTKEADINAELGYH
jgi:hypothetical protein